MRVRWSDGNIALWKQGPFEGGVTLSFVIIGMIAKLGRCQVDACAKVSWALLDSVPFGACKVQVKVRANLTFIRIVKTSGNTPRLSPLTISDRRDECGPRARSPVGTKFAGL